MKYKFWILVLIVGGVLMIVGSAIGTSFYSYLLSLAIPLIAPEFHALVTVIMNALGYIAYFGGYSVLVAVFLILIKINRLGRIIITIATGFGMLGLIIFAATWIIGYFNITIDPMWQTILNQVYSLFTFNSGLAFTGTALAVFGKFGLKRAEKADEDEDEAEEKPSSDSKSCPSCGASLPARANFCNKCGKNFD